MLFRPVRFCVNFVGITLLLLACVVAAQLFFAVDIGNSGSSIIPLMMAGMLEGQNFVKRAQGRPSNRAMWRAAIGMTWLATLLSMVLLAALLAISPGTVDVLKVVPPLFWAIGLVAILAVQLLVVRFAFGGGVKTGMRTLPAPA